MMVFVVTDMKCRVSPWGLMGAMGQQLMRGDSERNRMGGAAK
jgi:hypothetical protein